MHGPYPGELRVRVIRFVEGGGSRREAAEQFDVSVSSAIRWVQHFREDGTCEPIPRGGSTSSAGDADRYRRYAAELVALAPDVILASGGSVVGPLRQATRTVPIVFVQVSDPVGAGFVDSLARPGGNATGFRSSNSA